MRGLICRMDRSGLGQGQTLRLARLLKPDKVMLIDSTSFNGNKQFPEWYKDYDKTVINGFPTEVDIREFLDGVDVVLTCETFYSRVFTIIAGEMNKKTVIIANPEFYDWFTPSYNSVTPPDKVIVPSYWKLDQMKEKFNAVYLPTPIFDDEFKQARQTNLKRSGKRYLFMNGKTAVHDRNGLESLYEALPYAKGDFEIVVKAQGEVKKHPDPRLTYDFSNPNEQYKLYEGFDAMILPRRYGGQTLSMTEALQSALPVIMPRVEPNDRVLPFEWLIPATKTGEFMARTMIDIYSADPVLLANKLDNLDTSLEAKQKALEIGKQYDAETLRPKYEELLSSL